MPKIKTSFSFNRSVLKTVSIMLTIALLLGAIPLFATFVNGTTTVTDSIFVDRLANAQARFKQGEYFAGNDGAYSNLTATSSTLLCRGTNNAGTTCVAQGYCGYSGACTCSCGTYYYGGTARCWQCWAFACQIGYDIFGLDSFSGWNKHRNAASITAGDIIRFSWSTGYQPHSIFVTKVVGNTVYYADSNASGPCQVNWNNTRSVSSIQSLLNNRSDAEFAIYHAPNSNVGKNPTSYKYTTVTEGTYYIKNVYSGNYLSVEGCVDANNTNISLSEWVNGSTGMLFSIKACSDGYKIRPLCSSTRLVNAYGSSPSSGANVNIWEDLEESSEWWKFEAVSQGYILHNTYVPSCVLDTDGINVLIANKHGGTAQIWVLQTQAEAEAENNPLSYVSIDQRPTKTIYDVGETLDTRGLIVTLTYKDGSSKNITEGFTVSGFDSSTTGSKTVTVTYEGKSTSFNVIVRAVIDDDSPQIVIDSKKAIIGKTVNVTLSLKNNPGITSMRLHVSYDTSVLTLTNVSDGGILGTSNHPDNLNTHPYIVSWANDTSRDNYTSEGVIVTLTFSVSETATLGDHNITVSYDNDMEEILNVDLETVDFYVTGGIVTVSDVLIGDINGDGKVTSKDRIILARYLDKWEGYETLDNELAADVNGDGKVTSKDRIILSRYLDGWGEEYSKYFE